MTTLISIEVIATSVFIPGLHAHTHLTVLAAFQVRDYDKHRKGD
jgi:hypothetical protein